MIQLASVRASHARPAAFRWPSLVSIQELYERSKVIVVALLHEPFRQRSGTGTCSTLRWLGRLRLRGKLSLKKVTTTADGAHAEAPVSNAGPDLVEARARHPREPFPHQPSLTLAKCERELRLASQAKLSTEATASAAVEPRRGRQAPATLANRSLGSPLRLAGPGKSC